MRRRRDRSYEIKTPAQLALMREAGLVVAAALSATVRAVEPGISTAELDAIAERVIRDAGAVPSFKGYQGFPATICTSVNDEVVHGIPRPEVRLAAGDLISVDCGAIVGGWHGDAAVTVGVGPLTPAQSGLLETCERALWQGLSHAVPGGRPRAAGRREHRDCEGRREPPARARPETDGYRPASPLPRRQHDMLTCIMNLLSVILGLQLGVGGLAEREHEQGVLHDLGQRRVNPVLAAGHAGDALPG